MDRADKIKKQRARAFFDELAAGRLALTEDLINQDEFLHAFDATIKAALQSRRDEKVRMFARLLRRGVIECEHQSFDDYEELVNLLSDLSHREWCALILFESHLAGTDPNSEALQRVMSFWKAFVLDLENNLGVSQNEASSFMNRLARTGLYNEITGAYWDYEGGQGITTPKMARFRQMVEADQ